MESLILLLLFAGLILWGVGSVVLNDSNKTKLKELYDKHFFGEKKALDAGDMGDGLGVGDDVTMAESDPTERRLQQLEGQLESLMAQSDRDRSRIETLEKLVTDSGYQTDEAIRRI